MNAPSNTSAIISHVADIFQGELPLSFRDPAASDLVRSIGALTAREVHQIGLATVELVLARQQSSAQAEREIQLMRDRSQPLC